jgi:hypothetical protein
MSAGLKGRILRDGRTNVLLYFVLQYLFKKEIP